MIVVTGSLSAKPDGFEEARRLSLEHVRRSRAEPGCLCIRCMSIAKIRRDWSSSNNGRPCRPCRPISPFWPCATSRAPCGHWQTKSRSRSMTPLPCKSADPPPFLIGPCPPARGWPASPGSGDDGTRDGPPRGNPRAHRQRVRARGRRRSDRRPAFFLGWALIVVDARIRQHAGVKLLPLAAPEAGCVIGRIVHREFERRIPGHRALRETLAPFVEAFTSGGVKNRAATSPRE
jgi:hypothetical protein